MLKVKDLTVCYGKRAVLESISFSLEKGSFTALLGLNGSGKSTLLSTLVGDTRFAGEVLFEGAPLSVLSVRERAKRLTLLPQLLPTPPFTVAETVAFGRNPYTSLSGRLTEEDKRVVAEAMEKTAVFPLAERYLSTLSGGERQMTFLAMALAQKTPVLLLDEPTSFLDKAKERHFWSTLAHVRQQEKTTVLAAMHDLTAAVSLADRFLILADGGLAFDGAKEELLATTLLRDVFGARRYDTEDGPVFA